MITAGTFLNAHERSLAAGMRTGYPDVKMVFYGGFEDAERTVAVMLPEYIPARDFASLCEHFSSCPQDDPLAVIEVQKDKFSPPLNHRDYLGALMGLGIKREMIGDIAVTDSGCKIAVLERIAPFIAENLGKAGRGTLSVKIIPAALARSSSASVGSPDSFTVSSLRLDSIVKNAFSLSRTNACAAIEGGTVFVNDLECTKSDKKISPGDKVVLRKKGRIIIGNCSGVSKRGRIIVEITRFS